MKTKLLITFLLSYVPYLAFSCMCSSTATTANKYQEADFVGLVKILKTYKNDIDSIDRYRVDVKTLSLFKGKQINKLITEGFNQVPLRWSSCGVYFTIGQNYLVYGKINENDGKAYVSYCGVTRYSIENEVHIIKKIKQYAENITVDTRWGRTTYIPSQLYMRFNPASSNHLSLIKVDVNKKNNQIIIKHLTKDDKNLKLIMKDVFMNKLNWKSKLEEKYYPDDKYTFIFELYPYTKSKSLKEKGYLLN